jgi:hypothetical protein
MNPGDMILVWSHSYPVGWVKGQDPHRYDVPTPVIFLSEFSETGGDPRVFYNILTPGGVHHIYSGFCQEVGHEAG